MESVPPAPTVTVFSVPLAKPVARRTPPSRMTRSAVWTSPAAFQADASSIVPSPVFSRLPEPLIGHSMQNVRLVPSRRIPPPVAATVMPRFAAEESVRESTTD